MSHRDIEDSLRDIYGAELSQGMISKITDKILPEANEWQNRPLETVYPIIHLLGRHRIQEPQRQSNCQQVHLFRFIACHDNLKGLEEAVKAVFPKTKQQLCIVHQVRNSAKFVPWKDRKAAYADLKKIYGAVNLDAADYAREEFREKVGSEISIDFAFLGCELG